MKRDSRQVLTEWLVLDAQSGSESAFAELHELWRADLQRLALGKVERPEAAEEVLMDVWLAIARGLHRLSDPACFPRWAFQIVERRSADWIRQRNLARRREEVAFKSAEELAPASLCTDEPSDDVVRLRTIIRGLPADQRELLQLYYELDRSVSEIAEILSVPLGTVKSRLYAVRETLKKQLERKLP